MTTDSGKSAAPSQIVPETQQSKQMGGDGSQYAITPKPSVVIKGADERGSRLGNVSPTEFDRTPSPVLIRLHANQVKAGYPAISAQDLMRDTSARAPSGAITSPRETTTPPLDVDISSSREIDDVPKKDKSSFMEEHAVLLVFLGIAVTVGSGCLILLTIATAINSINYPEEDANSYFNCFREADPAQIQSLLNVLVVVNSTVLVLVLEVTTILLQIAAARFSSVVFTFFFQSPRTMFLLGFFLFNNVNVIIIASISGDYYQPRTELLTCTLLTIICVITLYPYFIDTFQITSAEAIIKKLGDVALHATLPTKNSDANILNSNKHRTATAIERLANMGLNAVQQSDKMYACRVVNELSELVLKYQEHKNELPETWHAMQQWNRENPDFFSLDSEGIADVVRCQTWLEWKVLRQYQMLFDHGIAMKAYGECCLIAVNTRKICERCASVGQTSVVDLCIKFFNTFLRYAISAGDGRSCSNLLHQYRQAGEYLLYHHQYCIAHKIVYQEKDNDNKEERPVMVTKYLAYYAELALKRNLGPITELCAHDLSSMCQLAYVMNSPLHDRILSTFLCVDDIASALQIETAVMGIRKAQIKLATTYMENGDEELAKQIQEDMAEDPPDRLRIVKRQLQDFNEKEFWEVGDRGTNVDYLKPSQQRQLQKFFAWFGENFFDEDYKCSVRISAAPDSMPGNQSPHLGYNATAMTRVSTVPMMGISSDSTSAADMAALRASAITLPQTTSHRQSKTIVQESVLRSRHNSVLFPSTQRDSRMFDGPSHRKSNVQNTQANGRPNKVRNNASKDPTPSPAESAKQIDSNCAPTDSAKSSPSTSTQQKGKVSKVS